MAGAGADGPGLLARTEAFDGLLAHPLLTEISSRVLGAGAALCGFGALHRAPMVGASAPGQPFEVQSSGVLTTVACAGDGDDPLALSRVWHREDIGVVAGAAGNAYFAPSLQAIVYLHDVTPGTHCFSIVPESAAAKRAMPTYRHADGRGPVLDDAAARVDMGCRVMQTPPRIFSMDNHE